GDLDGDGKLDVVFATGFVLRPDKQEPHIPQIQMNRSSGIGNFKFEDEAAARLPKDFAVQAGMVAVFDMNCDGAMDIVFAQMGGRPARLLWNDGKGKFTEADSEHFPNIAMSSPSVEAGDVDNDRDLDLVFGDHDKVTRLFINEGNGKFTDATDARMPKITIPVAQDATFMDIDNDFDLDLVVLGKHKNGQNLFLNDGKGNFSDATKSLNYAGSDNNYEAEWADLDNDGDVDAFWVSMDGYTEGASKNLLKETGNLAFEHSMKCIEGHNNDDDNEITFIDVNNDGLLDVIDGSLAFRTEKVYITSKDFKFTFSDCFGGKRDPSCDGAAGDFDGDGAIDYVSCVGESGTGNKLYRNTGPKDTVAPKILGVGLPKTISLSSIVGFAVHAFVQDSFYDDGKDAINCYIIFQADVPSLKEPQFIKMRGMGGHLFRRDVGVSQYEELREGMTVEITIQAIDASKNESRSTPVKIKLTK
ncbi:MAG: FG-GAP repeat domain-containing protein, partial [Planctomycetota bacterium]